MHGAGSRRCHELVGSDDNNRQFDDADKSEEEKRNELDVVSAGRRSNPTSTAVDSMTPTSSRRRSAWSSVSTVPGDGRIR